MKNPITHISLLLMAFVVLNCKDKKKDPQPETGTGTLKLYFDNQAGLVYDDLTKLVIDSNTDTLSALPSNGTYTNAFGNQLSVTQLRYFISNVVLTKDDGSLYTEPNSYHLIDVRKDVLKEEFILSGIPVGKYTKINFTIGVDSAANHDLTKKAGDLSEIIGMSWSWNTGYIFLKIEGRYSKNARFLSFAYHVGLDKNLQTFAADLPEAAAVVTTGSPEIHIKANALSVFGPPDVAGTTIIDLGQLNNSMGDANNLVIAKNYGAAMFKIDHVHQAGEE